MRKSNLLAVIPVFGTVILFIILFIETIKGYLDYKKYSTYLAISAFVGFISILISIGLLKLAGFVFSITDFINQYGMIFAFVFGGYLLNIFSFTLINRQYFKKQANDKASGVSFAVPTLSFLDLLNRNEEFAFSYEGVTYEIVMGNEQGQLPGVSLFLSDGERGMFIQSFHSKEELLNQGTIKGKRIADILSDIVI